MKTEKIKKLVANFHDKKEYVIHIRNAKEARNRYIKIETRNRYIKIVLIEPKRNYLVSKPNYHTTSFIFRKFVRNWNKKNADTHE